MSVSPIPPGFHTITPYLLVDDGAALLAFVEAAFEAVVEERMEAPDGSVRHAQVCIGDSKLMLGGAREEWPAAPTMLYLYVADCDDWYRRALAAGAESIQEPRDEFYGDRTAAVKGPCGNSWYFATHTEDLEPDEIARRAAANPG